MSQTVYGSQGPLSMCDLNSRRWRIDQAIQPEFVLESTGRRDFVIIRPRFGPIEMGFIRLDSHEVSLFLHATFPSELSREEAWLCMEDEVAARFDYPDWKAGGWSAPSIRLRSTHDPSSAVGLGVWDGEFQVGMMGFTVTELIRRLRWALDLVWLEGLDGVQS